MIYLTATDYAVAIKAMEQHITTTEEQLIKENAGDTAWDALLPYYETLNNLKLVRAFHEQQQKEIPLR